jgi:hypothetical protein
VQPGEDPPLVFQRRADEEIHRDRLGAVAVAQSGEVGGGACEFAPERPRHEVRARLHPVAQAVGAIVRAECARAACALAILDQEIRLLAGRRLETRLEGRLGEKLVA